MLLKLGVGIRCRQGYAKGWLRLGLGAGSRLRKSHNDRNIRKYVSECASGGNARSSSASQGNRGSGSISLSTVLQPTHTHTHTRATFHAFSHHVPQSRMFSWVSEHVCLGEADTGCKADIYMRRCACDRADVCVILCVRQKPEGTLINGETLICIMKFPLWHNQGGQNKTGPSTNPT